MSHPVEAWAANLERFRPFLLLLARRQLGARWQGKLEASVLVQGTFLDAIRSKAAPSRPPRIG